VNMSGKTNRKSVRHGRAQPRGHGVVQEGASEKSRIWKRHTPGPGRNDSLPEAGVATTPVPELDRSRALSKYERPNLRKAVWRLLDTVVPYVTLGVLLVLTVPHGYPYWMVFALAGVAAGLLVRIFIFVHAYCHASCFPSRRANRILGYVSGLLTFTPPVGRRFHT
jgi:hypothetical protein